MLVSGSYDRTIRIWDATDGKVSVGVEQLHSHRKAPSKQRCLLLLASFAVYRHAKRQPTSGLCPPRTNASSHHITFSFGKQNCKVSPNAHVNTHPQTTQELRRLDRNQHTAPITSVKWHPNGALIASTSADNTTCLWDASTGTYMHTVTSHQSPATRQPTCVRGLLGRPWCR